MILPDLDRPETIDETAEPVTAAAHPASRCRGQRHFVTLVAFWTPASDAEAKVHRSAVGIPPPSRPGLPTKDVVGAIPPAPPIDSTVTPHVWKPVPEVAAFTLQRTKV
jgi:hypothetical protein